VTSRAVEPGIGQELPTCKPILDVIGDLFADVCQLEEFLLDNGIFGLLGKIVDTWPPVAADSRPTPYISPPKRPKQSRIAGYWPYITLAMLAICRESAREAR
jgi:hypothetical protein